MSERSSSGSNSRVQSPKAKKRNRKMENFGDMRNDPFHWFQDPFRKKEFVAHLRAENAYTLDMMSDTEEFRRILYEEMKRRVVNEDNGDEFAAVRRRPNYNHHRWSLTGKNTPVFKNLLSDLEELNISSELEAQAEDINGNEIYTITVSDGRTVDTLVGVTNIFERADRKNLVYIAMDETHRPYKACLHKLGEKQASDTCLYHEEDNKFSLHVRASENKKFLFVTSQSYTTSFNFYLDGFNPEGGLKVLTPREDGVDTSVSHRGNHFFILRRTDKCFNSEVIARPLDITAETTVLLRHRESVKIEAIQLFENHLVVYERENGLPILSIYGLSGVEEPVQSLQGGFTVRFDESTYSVERSKSQFTSSYLKILYSSLKTPWSTYKIDMKTGNRVLKKRETVLGGYDASNYVTERKWANAPDGTQIPISIIYLQDPVKLDGSAPLVLTGYGSYETCTEPSFEASRLSLLDRGIIYAIAHIRGGGEMGRQWYENGKLLNKKNTFTDFIACAEYLIENKYCSKDKLCIIGGSAGGLLIGAVLNMKPDLFKAAVAQVPFVDVLTTMLDRNIPGTTLEWEEWGDPREKEFYHYMKSYAPVDNVKAQNYPNILVTTGFNDSRVLCSEPAKFVAKLRDQKTDDNKLFLYCDFKAGHFPKSRLEADAFEYAFIMNSLNMSLL